MGAESEGLLVPGMIANGAPDITAVGGGVADTEGSMTCFADRRQTTNINKMTAKAEIANAIRNRITEFFCTHVEPILSITG